MNYLELCRDGEGFMPRRAHQLIMDGNQADVCRVMAICRGSEAVAAVLLSSGISVKDDVHAALLCYGMGARAQYLIDRDGLVRRAAAGSNMARTAWAYLNSNASVLPEKIPEELMCELEGVREARNFLLQRDSASENVNNASKPDVETKSSPDFVNIHGVNIHIRAEQSSNPPQATIVWCNDKLIYAAKLFASGLSSGVPIVLEGPPGSGKSELINFMATVTGNGSVQAMHKSGKAAVQINPVLMGSAHLSTSAAYSRSFESISRSEAKARLFRTSEPCLWSASLNDLPSFCDLVLMDMYTDISGLARIHLDGSSSAEEDLNDMFGSVVPEKNGEFRWRPGPLGCAIRDGRWVVLEGLPGPTRQAASSGVQAIVEALVNLRPGDSFQVRGGGESLKVASGYQIIATRTTREDRAWEPPGGSQTWCRIQMASYSKEAMGWILCERFPEVEECVARVVKSIDRISQLPSQSQNLSKQLSVREGIKVCKRLIALKEVTVELAVVETVDVMCASEMKPDNRTAAIAAICDAWSAPVEVGQNFDSLIKPTVEFEPGFVKIGRATLESARKSETARLKLAPAGESLRLLERVGRCVEVGESVLLNGESGTGKTAIVQELARLCGKTLVVVNMSQQSDVNELVGGYRPTDVQRTLQSTVALFDHAFRASFSLSKNKELLDSLFRMARRKQLHKSARLMRKVLNTLPSGRRSTSESVTNLWRAVESGLRELEVLAGEEAKSTESPSPHKRRRTMKFHYAEGMLLNAMRKGSWVLLDEINLAPVEALESLVSLLDDYCLPAPEGQGGFVRANSGFSIFAAMNPPTDMGKKKLPDSIRARFTEFFVADMESHDDLLIFVLSRLHRTAASASKEDHNVADRVSRFFISCRKLSKDGLIQDAAGRKPRFSLRSLSRMLDFARGQLELLPRDLASVALYEGSILAFVTPLPASSRDAVLRLSREILLAGSTWRRISDFISVSDCIKIGGFLVESGNASEVVQHDAFVITPSVAKTLEEVTRAVAVGTNKLPVLLQGPTAAGKTSLVSYLARRTKHKIIRINNHEHTDVAEYLGGYIVNEDGVPCFKEGPLVEAARKGWWIVLDELNLAPGEVLEALNRLLDDNRELTIPETGEVVKASPKFALFATQNPPGLYGGRKQLSQAFLSRFIEIHINSMPDEELSAVLCHRGRVPESFAKSMIAIMHDLQIERSSSKLFQGKDGFVTARDLFRWASRLPRDRQELANFGFFLLAERARDPRQVDTIRRIIEKYCRASICSHNLYESVWSNPAIQEVVQRLQVYPTKAMMRMVALAWECATHGEPALLVGATGGGKTTACQVVSEALGVSLYTVNLHRNSEASDFLGGYRPTRTTDRSSGKLFEWCDGPLVAAMRDGSCLLLDELNMADHAVAERLNSVLEPERTLFLAEKGGDPQAEIIVADPKFQVLATMNPGGDFGKKELSPALQNRFTEIWCPPPESEDFERLTRDLLQGDLTEERMVADVIVDFAKWGSEHDITLSLRDITAWCSFIRNAAEQYSIRPQVGLAHGVRLILLDGMELMSGNSLVGGFPTSDISKLAWERIIDSIEETDVRAQAREADFTKTVDMIVDEEGVQFAVFRIRRGLRRNQTEALRYAYNTRGTAGNCARVARAFLLPRAILLEGPPGVGKTSMVEALAEASGYFLVRVNLSEHTEMADLLGCDVPTAIPGKFRFKEGPLLSAMRGGHWILLDELNLASQSVLEGLNSVLDHRQSAFIPELQREVKAANGFRLFGAQNPANEGGGRRRLPQSFINRFTRVYVRRLDDTDIVLIASTLYPWVEPQELTSLSVLMRELYQQGLLDLNLRDVLRWVELRKSTVSVEDVYDTLIRKRLVLSGNDGDEIQEVSRRIFEKAFGYCAIFEEEPRLQISAKTLTIGPQTLPRGDYLPEDAFRPGLKPHPQILNSQLGHLRSIALSVGHCWPVCLRGVSDSGKESLLNAFANICGVQLRQVWLSSASDTSDLLGGYEQHNQMKGFLEVKSKVDSIASHLVRSLISDADDVGAANVEHARISADNAVKAYYNGKLHDESLLEQIRALLDVCSRLSSHDSSGLSRIREQLDSIPISDGAAFRWTRSELVQAAERGDWVLLRNANQIPHAVLDRLNPLLEKPGGESILAEAPPDDNGDPQVFRPHRNFRLFMTMDPRDGDISKALRNRCVEIAMGGKACASNDNLSAFAFGSGIPGPLGSVSNFLVELDKWVAYEFPNEKPPSQQIPLRSRLLVAHGKPWLSAIQEATLELYRELPKEILDKLLQVKEHQHGILDRSAAEIGANTDCFEAHMEAVAIHNLLKVDVEAENTGFVAAGYVSRFLNGFRNSESREMPVAMLGLYPKASTRSKIIEEVFAEYVSNYVERDREIRIDELSSFEQEDAAIRETAEIAKLSLLSVREQPSSRSHHLACSIKRNMRKGMEGSKRSDRSLRIISAVAELAEATISQEQYVDERSMLRALEILKKAIVVSSSEDHHGSVAERLIVLFHYLKATSPSLIQLLDGASAEALLLHEPLGALVRVKDLPVPKSLLFLELETSLTSVLRVLEGEGKVIRDPQTKKFVVEALCTLSTDVGNNSKTLASELHGFTNLLKMGSGVDVEDPKLVPTAKYLDGVSLAYSLKTLLSKSKLNALAALTYGLQSSSVSPNSLVSLQRVLWGSGSEIESELQWLQRLWEWNKRIDPPSSLDWALTGPASALIFDGPLKMMLSLQHRGGPRNLTIENRSTYLEETFRLAGTVVSGSNSWLGGVEALEGLSTLAKGDPLVVDGVKAHLDAVARMWISSGQDLINKFLPGHQIDPAVAAQELSNAATEVLVRFKARVTAMNVMAAVRLGHDEKATVTRQKNLEAEMETDRALIEVTADRIVPRLETLDPYDRHWHRLRRFCDEIASGDKVADLIKRMGTDVGRASDLERAWQGSVANVTRDYKIDGVASHLRDALGGVALGLERLRLGVRLYLTSLKVHEGGDAVLSTVDNLVSMPMSNLRETFHQRFATNLGLQKVTLLRLAYKASSVSEEWSSIYSAVEAHIKSWRVLEDAKLWEITNAQSLYTYGSVCRPNESLEEAEERDFRATFGDVEVDYDIANAFGGISMAEKNAGDKPKRQSVTDSMQQIWEIFRGLVNADWKQHASSKSQFLVQTYAESFHVAYELLSKNPCMQPMSSRVLSQQAAVAHLSATLCLKENGYALPSTSKTSRNFYKDAFPEEIRSIVVRLSLLTENVRRLKRDLSMEEHPVLGRIESLAAKISNSDYSTSLSRLTVSVEGLLRLVDEWNRFYAKSDLKLSEDERQLAFLTAKWRSYEISSWPNILASRIVAPKEITGRWFPHMFEIVRRHLLEPEDGSGMAGVLSTLDQFLRSSSIGELASRVELVGSFSKLVQHSPDNTERKRGLRNALASLAGYYRQFQNAADIYLEQQKAPLEKRMREYVRLGEWDKKSATMKQTTGAALDDKALEYFRLKAVADRNRRNLHRLCTEMDAVLRTQISTIEILERSKMGLDNLETEPESYNAPFIDLEDNCFQHSANKNGPSIYEGRLKDAQALTGRINKLADKLLSRTWTKAGTQSCRNLERVARRRALELSKLELTKDLVPIKQRALSELLRALVKSGLSSRRADIEGNHEKWIITSPTGVERIDREFYTCIFRQSRLNEVSGLSLNTDVSRRDANQMRGLSDHLLSVLTEDRSFLFDARILVEEIEAQSKLLLRAAISASGKMGEGLYGMTAKLCRIIKDIAFEATTLSSTLDATAALEKLPTARKAQIPKVETERSFGKTSSLLKLTASTLTEGLGDDHGLGAPGSQGFADEKQAATCQRLIDTIARNTSRAEQLEESNITSPFILSARREVDEFFQRTNSDEEMSDEPLSRSTWTHLEGLASACVERVLLGTQRLSSSTTEGLPDDSGSESEDALVALRSIRNGHEKATELVRKLNVVELGQDVKVFISEALKVEGKKSTEIRDLCYRLGLVLDTFVHHVLRVAFNDVFDLHREGCSLLRCIQSIFITVCQKGFCKPVEEGEEDQGEGNDREVEGTGMGDVGAGDTRGAEDVSKEIKDEGELDNLATGEQEKENPGDQPETTVAGIEMSNDFEGEMETVQQNEEQEDENSDESDEDEELEKRFGEDEDKQEEIDEKLWGPEDEDKDENEEQDDTVEKGKSVQTQQQESEIGRKDDSVDDGPDEPKLEQEEDREKLDDRAPDEQGDNDPQIEEEVPAESNFKMDTEEPPGDEEPQEFPGTMEVDGESGASGTEPDEADVLNEKDSSLGSGEEGDDGIGSDAEMQEQDGENTSQKDIDEDGDDDDFAFGGEVPKDDPDSENDERPRNTQPNQSKDADEDMELDDGSGSKHATTGAEKEPTEELEDEQGNKGERDQTSSGAATDQQPKTLTSKSGIGEEEEVTGEADDDVNPGRVPAPELESRWKKRFEMLKKAVQSQEEPEEHHKNDEPAPGAAEFDDEGEEAGVGKATDDQHAPMEDAGIEEEDENQRRAKREEEPEKSAAQDETDGTAIASKPNPTTGDQHEKGESEDTGDDAERNEKVEPTNMEIDESWTMKGTANEVSKVRLIQEEKPAMDEDEEMHARREDTEDAQNAMISHERAQKEWTRLEQVTSQAAGLLCEQLKLLLEPTLASRLEGDYRTGKRLSMRRVIEFIASDYRRDRIWLRRTKADKRAYDVLICVDDSESMAESGAGTMALEALALLSSALSRLEVGRVGVESFGTNAKLLHKLDAGMGPNGPKLVSSLTFKQKETNMREMLEFSLEVLDEARGTSLDPDAELAQLLLIISDGKLDDRERIQSLVREAATKRQVIAFFLIDKAEDEKQSVRNVKKAIFKDGKMHLDSYLDDFPFPFYAIVSNTELLPEVIGDCLKQWLELLNFRI
ncbi:hypothetical protein NDN08_003681 [Rhodosorus marinus]|uniref:Midasin n=1 Tax=Rhodosorus marinus TaxID=101924 RepID=A0AAV8UX69_9RHOD|nr:hypothetical protein NDN08_003681 [Rhodosorus marinus]